MCNYKLLDRSYTLSCITALALMISISTTATAQWENIPGKALDIAAAGDSIFSVWHIGESNAIFKWNEDTFSWENYGGKGSRIAVESNGTPWIINNNQMYRLRGRTWQSMPGKAIAIGAGGGTVWSIGQSGAVYKWNDDTFTWENFGGKASEIAVDSDGIPWIINNKQIYRLRGRTWQNLPGKALAIGAGGGKVWHIGESEAAFLWDEESFTWANHGGKSKRITVTGNGVPYTIESGVTGSLIYRLRRF